MKEFCQNWCILQMERLIKNFIASSIICSLYLSYKLILPKTQHVLTENTVRIDPYGVYIIQHSVSL